MDSTDAMQRHGHMRAKNRTLDNALSEGAIRPMRRTRPPKPCHGCTKAGRAGVSCRRQRWPSWLFPLIGLASLFWFLIRVVPKPSRATYPCQRLAAPIAANFVVWLTGTVGSTLAYRKAKRLFSQSHYAGTALFLALAVGAMWWAVSTTSSQNSTAGFVPSDPPNNPIGIGQGIHPGRVIWFHAPDAAHWDGVTGAWWDDENTDQGLVDCMVSQTLRALTGESNDANAWDALFRHFNYTRGVGDFGYRTNEKIAVKINLNQDGGQKWGADDGMPSPQVVHALLDQLVNAAGVAASDITVYDASRYVGDPIVNKINTSPDPNLQGIRFAVNPRWVRSGRVAVNPDWTRPVRFSSPEVPEGATGYLPQCVTEATYLINVALLRAHQRYGVTFCSKNHFGSIYFDEAGWSPLPLHPFGYRSNFMGTYNSLVDLLGHAHLGGKTLFYMIDGLYSAEHQNGGVIKYESFGDAWCSSLLLSQDPVAIDSVALDIVRNEPRAPDCMGQGVDNYLHEAALAADPPSGTLYDPEGDGTRLESLGVHEHWNNSEDKQYSRNLGLDEGIELIILDATNPTADDREGDLTADGRVDGRDLKLLASTWLADPGEPNWLAASDTFGDLYINFNDYAELSRDWRWGIREDSP